MLPSLERLIFGSRARLEEMHAKLEEESVVGSLPSRGWSACFQRFPDDSEGHTVHTGFPQFNIQAGKRSHWKSFPRVVGGIDCLYCSRRLASHFINSPDQLATVFVDSTEMCYVELLFVDLGDGISEWRYRFYHSGLPSFVD